MCTTEAFCQRNRIPHDAALLIKQYPSPYEVVNLPQALQCFGLNNSQKQSSIAQLSNVNLPRLAILNPASQTTIQSASITESDNESNPSPATDEQADTQQATPTHGIALILRRNDQRLLVLQPNQAEPITVSIEDFTKQITGDFLKARKAEETVADDGNTVSASNILAALGGSTIGFTTRTQCAADEPPVPQMNPGQGKTQKAYLWAYRSNALTAEPPMLVFDYQPGWHGIHVRNFLAGWQGHLMVDDYVLRTTAR